MGATYWIFRLENTQPTPGPPNGQRWRDSACTEKDKYTEKEKQDKTASPLMCDGQGPAAGVPTPAPRGSRSGHEGPLGRGPGRTMSQPASREKRGLLAPRPWRSQLSCFWKSAQDPRPGPGQARWPALARGLALHTSSGHPPMTPLLMFEVTAFYLQTRGVVANA